MLKFRQYIGIRPCVTIDDNPLNYIRKLTDGEFDKPKIDTTVFRQNTEGMYAGIEWTNPPENVRGALASHAKFKAFAQVAGPDIAVSVRVITRPAARRIVTAAFEYAKKRGFKGVTICEKPNVVRETSGM